MNRTRSVFSVAGVVVLIGALAPAHEAAAEFRIAEYGGTPPGSMQAAPGAHPGSNGVVQGAAAHFAPDGKYDNPVVQGFAENLPMHVLMNQLLPDGWEVYYADPAVKDKEASWTGGRPLTDVLDTLAAEADVDIEADLDRRRLYMSKAIARTGQLSVAGARGNGLATNPTTRRYVLKSGQTISEALRVWTETSGYHLAWELEIDYPIEHDATLTGTLHEVVGQVAESYRRQGAMRDTEFVFKEKNRVLVVRKYDRTISARGESR